MENELIVQDEPLTALEIRNQVNLIQQMMKEVMVEDTHYGLIPGCGDKPSLLKPGAEKLMMTFRLAPKYDIQEVDLPNGHKAFRIVCSLWSIKSGRFLGEGVGSASTMESKWRFRTGPKESTGKPVPQEYWKNRDIKLIGGKGFITMKDDAGAWVIGTQGEKVEHDNPADYYNTCLKMGKKRALVDATLTVTAASDIFTQDVEEEAETAKDKGETKKSEPKGNQTPKKQEFGHEHSDEVCTKAQVDEIVRLVKANNVPPEITDGFLADANKFTYGSLSSKQARELIGILSAFKVKAGK